jgi:uncharacterized protein HemX
MSTQLVIRLSDASVWLGLNLGAILAALALGVAGIWFGQWRQSLEDAGTLARYAAENAALKERPETTKAAYYALWEERNALDDVNYALRQELQMFREMFHKEALP